MKTKRLFVYTEDAPVRRDVVARGMSRAGSPLLRSVSDCIDRIAVFNKHKWYGKQDIDPELAPHCDIGPRSTALLCKVLRRIGLREIADRLSAQFSIRLARKSTADIVFAYIGTDTGTLIRTVRLARSSGKAYALYLVDDFIASLRISGTDEQAIEQVREQVGEALRGAKHVFAITPGLCDQILTTFGVTAVTLPLTFEFQPAAAGSPPVKMQITYVGSVNFLYAEGLRDLFAVVEGIRSSGETELTIRLTVPARDATQVLGNLPDFVLAEPVEGAQALAKEIASSLFVFLPYSFHPDLKAMVSTSFPSKSMEYLAYARSIVVYGPEYGVTTRLFRGLHLPEVASSPQQLEALTRCHLAEVPDHSFAYRAYLAQAHSPAAARSTICGALGV